MVYPYLKSCKTTSSKFILKDYFRPANNKKELLRAQNIEFDPILSIKDLILMVLSLFYYNGE